MLCKMKEKKYEIRVIQLFETYGEVYQPYISPVIQALKADTKLHVDVVAFNAHDTVDFFVPRYKKRWLKEKWYALTHNSRLNYLEILCLEQQAAIIHVQQSYLFSKVTNLLDLPRDQRPLVVITLRGGDTYVKPWYAKKWQDFYKNYGHVVDAFVVMSNHQKNYLHDKWGVSLERVHVIPISFGQAFNASIKQADPSVMRIVSAFRMCWEKNIAGNLLAVKILKDRGIHVQYHLYGDGADSGQAYYLIDKYNLQDCVAYHGRLDNSELKAQLKRYDFYLQLSYSESLGMSVIEAQSLGLPAIVSNSDGLPEVVVQNQTGFCVAPHDSEAAATHLLQLWQNPDLYKQFSQKAIAFSHQHFSVETEVEALRRLYKSLIP